MTGWNPDQYLQFEKQRTLPASDLAGRIGLSAPKTVLDVGCGPGNSTNVLALRFPSAKILGIDNSENMVVAAKKAYPQHEFQCYDVVRGVSGLGRKFDIVFSNACLQWVPDHPRLLGEMMRILQRGGVLAVQVPMNFEEPVHKIIARLAESEKWAAEICYRRIFYTLKPEEYFDVLSALTDDFSFWQTTYYHRMKSHAEILEWYRSTGLRPYLDALAGDCRAAFENEVLAEVKKAYPVQENGEIIFRFPRFFFTARKKE